MSFQKINDILQNGGIINYNLISEQLKNTLIEICDLLQEQNQKITNIQNELYTKTSVIEFDKLKEDLQQHKLENEQQQQKISENIENQRQEVKKDLEESIKKLEKSMEETKTSITEDIVAKEKDLNGDIFIANQQIREINVKIIGQGTNISKAQAEIAKINKLLDSGKDKSLELLAVRVESCENKLNSFVSDQTTTQNELSAQLEEATKDVIGFKKEFANEIHVMDVELKEVRHMIVDAPTFDVDSTIDTSSLIRAIQRDSRRIDNFNETINSIKEDHLKLNGMCVDLCKAFGEFQVNVQGMIEQNNVQHKELVKKSAETSGFAIEVSKEVDKLTNNVRSTMESTLNGISQVSNDMLQLTSFLTKLTNRTTPTLGSFDDTLLELQQNIDITISQGEKFEEKIKNQESEVAFAPKIINEIKIPFISINIPTDLNTASYQSRIYTEERELSNTLKSSDKANSNLSSLTMIDFELKNNVQLLQQKVDSMAENIDKMKEKLESKIELKADTAVVERLLERHRTTINKMREKLSETVNSIGVCVKKGEIDKMMSLHASESPDILIQQPKSSLSVIPNRSHEGGLPRLSRRGEDSHKILYGIDINPQQHPTFHSGRI